jgi:hypothetical protein
VTINWKALLTGIVTAVARPQDAAIINGVIAPAVEGIIDLFARPPEAPPLTEAEVRVALFGAKTPWQDIERIAREELAKLQPPAPPSA